MSALTKGEMKEEGREDGWKEGWREAGGRMKGRRKSVNGATHQSHENAKELNDIRVGHRVKATHQGVQGGDER